MTEFYRPLITAAEREVVEAAVAWRHDGEVAHSLEAARLSHAVDALPAPVAPRERLREMSTPEGRNHAREISADGIECLLREAADELERIGGGE